MELILVLRGSDAEWERGAILLFLWKERVGTLLGREVSITRVSKKLKEYARKRPNHRREVAMFILPSIGSDSCDKSRGTVVL